MKINETFRFGNAYFRHFPYRFSLWRNIRTHFRCVGPIHGYLCFRSSHLPTPIRTVTSHERGPEMLLPVSISKSFLLFLCPSLKEIICEWLQRENTCITLKLTPLFKWLWLEIYVLNPSPPRRATLYSIWNSQGKDVCSKMQIENALKENIHL